MTAHLLFCCYRWNLQTSFISTIQRKSVCVISVPIFSRSDPPANSSVSPTSASALPLCLVEPHSHLITSRPQPSPTIDIASPYPSPSTSRLAEILKFDFINRVTTSRHFVHFFFVLRHGGHVPEARVLHTTQTTRFCRFFLTIDFVVEGATQARVGPYKSPAPAACMLLLVSLLLPSFCFVFLNLYSILSLLKKSNYSFRSKLHSRSSCHVLFKVRNFCYTIKNNLQLLERRKK